MTHYSTKTAYFGHIRPFLEKYARQKLTKKPKKAIYGPLNEKSAIKRSYMAFFLPFRAKNIFPPYLEAAKRLGRSLFPARRTYVPAQTLISVGSALKSLLLQASAARGGQSCSNPPDYSLFSRRAALALLRIPHILYMHTVVLNLPPFTPSLSVLAQASAYTLFKNLPPLSA